MIAQRAPETGGAAFLPDRFNASVVMSEADYLTVADECARAGRLGGR